MDILYSGKCIYNENPTMTKPSNFLNGDICKYEICYFSINGSTSYWVYSPNKVNRIKFNKIDFYSLFRDLGEFREERLNKILNDITSR
jgi:hypothetical protein